MKSKENPTGQKTKQTKGIGSPLWEFILKICADDLKKPILPRTPISSLILEESNQSKHTCCQAYEKRDLWQVDREHYFGIRKRLIASYFLFNQEDALPTDNVDANGYLWNSLVIPVP